MKEITFRFEFDTVKRVKYLFTTFMISPREY